MTVIQVKNLTKIYKRNHLFKTYYFTGIKDVSFEVKKGEIFVLLGLNGSGKTTTVKLLLNLIFPTSGEFKVLGKVGFLPEIPYFFPYLTAEEMLDYLLRISKVEKNRRKERIDYILSLVGLEEARKKLLKEFSKGMLKRICLGSSLIDDPEILILDEPYSGLDPVGIREMRNLILSLNENGKTIFMTSHIIGEVEKIAKRCGVLHKGEFKGYIDKIETGKLEDEFLGMINE
ncbi:MAG: ABC transporter ATP-binding protein [Caldiserica bacterium]|nr:MAG: ABC transporter ATP-binding protein [Caldisericota bacterium]